MSKNYSSLLVHFFGFHMFYYVIGFSCYIWFLLLFSTEYDGRPLALSLTYVWPLALLVYLPVAWHQFHLSDTKSTNPKRLIKYATGLLVYSFLTGVSSAGYAGVLYLAGGSEKAVQAKAVAVAGTTDRLLVYETANGKRFRVAAEYGNKNLSVRQSWFGYYFWEHRKI